MSRIVACIFCVFILGFGARAQERVCDLTAEFIWPHSGHVYTSPGVDSININIINLGPDSILPSDVYSIQLHFGGHHRFPKYASFDQHIAPNEKFAYKELFDVEYAGNVDSFNLCIEVYAVSPPYKDSLRSEKGTSDENNKVCVVAEHRDSTYVGSQDIDKVKGSLFPNPSSGNVNIRSGDKIHEVQIISPLGARVSDASISTRISDNKKEAYISGLASGMYIVQVLTDVGLVNHRLMVCGDSN